MSPMRLAVLVLLLSACGDTGSGTQQLSWQFADGRRCTESGVFTVTVGPLVDQPAPTASYSCGTGIPPGTATVMGVPRDTEITLHALSAAGGELYRGTLTTDDALQPAVITLYATGAN
jgi:hypothetical protein